MAEPSASDANAGKRVQRLKSSLTSDQNIDLRLAVLNVRLRGRKYFVRVMQGVYCCCIVAIVYAAFWPDLQPSWRIGIAAAGGTVAVFLAIPYFVARDFLEDDEAEVAELAARKVLLNRQTTEPASGKESITYFDRLVDINLSNLADYYFLIKDQANKGFSASLLASSLGFLLIAGGLAYGLFDKANSQMVTYVSATSGVITEFIAAVFFYIYNRTVRQMKGYHDNLLTVQNILLAFKIVDKTQNDSERTAMMKQVFAYLLGKSTGEADFASFPQN